MEKPLRRWGNAFGILVSRAEARKLGLHEGDLVDVDLQRHDASKVSELPSFSAGSIDLDATLARDHADP